MKLNKLLIIGVLLLAVFAIGAVSASEDVNGTNLHVVEDDVLSGEVEIDADDSEPFTIGDDDTITVEIPESCKGSLTVTIDGTPAKLYYDEECDEDRYIYVNHAKAKSTVLKNLPYDDDIEEDDHFATYGISLDKLAPGKIYDVVVKYVTSSKTYSESFRITLIEDGGEIPEDDVEIEVEDTYLFNKTGNRINVTAPKNLFDKLAVTINDVPYNLTKISDTKGYVDISKLGIGDYTIIVTGGDEPVEEEFEVVAIYWPESLPYGSSGNITLNLPYGSDGNLIVTIDEETVISAKVENSRAVIPIPSMGVGIHDINIKYPGPEGGDEEVDDEIEITPKVIYPAQMNVGEDRYMTVEVGDSEGTLIVTADYDPYETIKINGTARISLKNLDDGEITVSVRYVSEDYDYDDDFDILVNPAPIRIIAKNVNVVYTKNGAFTVKIYGTNSKPAANDYVDSIKIGKKVFKSVKINKNGIAKVDIPKNLAPGKYVITTNFEGVIAKNTLTVKHLLNLKKVKVKKSAKKLVLKATIKNLKKKKVVFKFNGKKYVAKTNKKGIAKVTLKKSTLKRLKVGKKVTYQATYLKDTVKRTVKVKK